MELTLEILKEGRRPRGVSCFAIVRNEEWLLPRFLRHYRDLGVSHFIFYDDQSTDRTLPLLWEQEDCTILTAAPNQDQPPLAWRDLQTLTSTSIPEHFGGGQWCIVADADEFLVLPSRFASINDLVDYLDHRELACVIAAMLDFYPERLKDSEVDTGSLFAESPWFDRDPAFWRDSVTSHAIPLFAGVRARMQDMLFQKHPERAYQIFGSKPGIARLSKVPLVKTGCGIIRTDAHNVNVPPPMGVQLALAHFKFYPGVRQRIEERIESGRLWDNSREYRFLQACYELLAEENLLYERSVRYGSAKDLEAAAVIWAD